jgi:hypothetical protein
MVSRRAQARRHATRAGGVSALLMPLLAVTPMAAPDAVQVSGPAPASAPVGTTAPVPGASVQGLEASEVVRVLAGVGSGTLSVPATSAAVTVPVGYPALGTEAPQLALEGTQDALNAALAQLRWTPAVAGRAAVTIDASPAGAGYHPANGHFYQVVTPPEGLHWDEARSTAATLTFEGRAGYLATITDLSEESLLATMTPDPAWIGGARQQGNEWAWATGPETGTTFWTPVCGTGTQGQCSANGAFSWWAPSEPRSLPGATNTTFLGGTGGGQWVPSADAATPTSYIVEFGGSAGDTPVAVAHADAPLTGTEGGGIGPITPMPGGTPVRSTPPTTVPPTTERPTTEPPTTEPPATVAPTVPPSTATTATDATAIGAAPVDTTAAPEPTDVATDTTTTTALGLTAAGASASAGLPVYIVFDVGVGTPQAEVKITVRGYNLSTGSALTVVAHSTPETLAVAAADATGSVVTDVGLPSDLADGEHTIVATATAADGSPLERQTQFALQRGVLSRIGPPPTTPPTTATTAAVAVAAVAETVSDGAGGGGGLPKPLLLVLAGAVTGAGVWLVTRRRKPGSAAGPSAPAAPAGTDRGRVPSLVPSNDRADQFR